MSHQAMRISSHAIGQNRVLSGRAGDRPMAPKLTQDRQRE